jgi:hypothetical protein
MKTGGIFICMIALFSCTKEAVNEKRLAGVWVADQVKYIFYANNEPVRDSTVQNSGELYLWDDDELGNQSQNTLSITPAGFTWTWEGDAADPLTLMGTTIQELTRRKLVVTEAISDTSLTVTQVIEYSFKRK